MATSPVDKVFDELGKMSVLDLVELQEEDRGGVGVTAAAPVAVAAPGAAPSSRATVPPPRSRRSSTSSLTGAGDKKIQVIKVVRAITGLGLKEARRSRGRAPNPVKEVSRRRRPTDHSAAGGGRRQRRSEVAARLN